MNGVRFKDRAEAGERLGERLLAEGLGRARLFGILRGGLVVAHHAALATDSPLRAVAASKLRAPGQPELAIGAVTDTGPDYLDELALAHLEIGSGYLQREIEERRHQAAMQQSQFGRVNAGGLAGVCVVVDDGLATGSTAIAAGRLLRSLGAERLVVAAPVAPPATLEKLAPGEFDSAVCLHAPRRFWAVGRFFDGFEAVGQAQLEELARAAGLGPDP